MRVRLRELFNIVNGAYTQANFQYLNNERA